MSTRDSDLIASETIRPVLWRRSWKAPRRRRLQIATTDGRHVASQVLVAADFATRLVGLLNRHALAVNEGLLLFPGGSIHTIGMRFVIDVLFLDRRLHILRAVSDLGAWRFAAAPRRTRFVLELASGRIAKLGLEPGMQLKSHSAARIIQRNTRYRRRL